MEKIKLPNRPIGPFPTVLAGVEVNGRPNYVTIGACGVVSLDAVLYISLKSTHYSIKGVKETGFFSVNIPSAETVRKTDYCGVVSGKNIDKSNLFTSFYDDLGRAPMIKECPMNMLCKVINQVPMFGFEMFFGEIVAVYGNEQCLTDGKLDPLKVNPIIMMGSAYFNLGHEVGQIFKEGREFKKELT
ncbi:flavin reductase family protein [Sporomusa sp.]|uniref:flavin reductase family protein n=1 Tax=Sporomusa sp. TaxID=2078658 RepID=UPI002C2B1B9D|nr:flavin reductase family protein [Sporomusa sp.]HWR06938.1 flavin reductase family protein [Sporomusa sp.]HWR42325.1 flavin reductase family protein [Sporomusa sp.]